MTIPSKADGNVPFLPGRKRYSLVGSSPTWVYHRMDAGASMDGAAPETVVLDAAHTDPTLAPGEANFAALTHGGLFTHIAKGRAVVIDAIYDPNSATFTTVDRSNTATTIRSSIPAVPFKLGANEVLKAVKGTTGTIVGVLVRLDSKDGL